MMTLPDRRTRLRYIAAQIVSGDRISGWADMGESAFEGPGVTITFTMYDRFSLQEAQKYLAALLSREHVDWLCPSSQGLWLFRSNSFKTNFPDYSEEAWLRGDILIPMDHDVRKMFDGKEDFTFCIFAVTPEVIEEQMPKKVFLSHSRLDKPKVRTYKAALESVGIVAWLDEDAMTAGIELERGLLAGFNESCAAVFFVTPNFRDENFLATEINYALAEKRSKGDRFRGRAQ
jgi:hypothetical protein